MDPYKAILQDLLLAPIVESRGMTTKETLNKHMTFPTKAVVMRHELIPDNTRYIKREIDWYLGGDRMDLSIIEHAKMWAPHVQDGYLNSNYGYWLWGSAGPKTFQTAMDIMASDNGTRRAIALIGSSDCIKVDTKDVPCTQSVQFIMRGKMHAIATMRSQDAWFGLRNDLAFFQFLLRTAAKYHDVEPGTLAINVGSFHLYEKHWSIARQILISTVPVRMTDYDFEL